MSQTDFTNARFCWEIDDNLDITTNFATVTADHLPYLQEVTGVVSVVGGNALEITLPRLEQVNGGFGAGNTPVERLFLPELRQVGMFGTTSSFTVALSVATEVRAPKLETIFGNLQLSGTPYLATADFGSLAAIYGGLTISMAPELVALELGALDARSDISGGITLEDLPNVPWSVFTPFLQPLRGGEDVSDVGCDTASTCNCGNTSCVPAP